MANESTPPPPPTISKSQALDYGLRFYWNGERCEANHLAKRYVDTDECFICRHNREKKLSITTAVSNAVIKMSQTLVATVDDDTLAFDPAYQDLKVGQLRELAKINGLKYFQRHEPCEFCNTNKRLVSNSSCQFCVKKRLKESRARYERIQIRKDLGIDFSVGTSKRLSHCQATILIAIIAHHYAGATTKTIYEELRKLYPDATTFAMHNKLGSLQKKDLIRTRGRVGRHTIYYPTNEFFYHYRCEVGLLCSYYENDPKSQAVIEDAFESVLHPETPEKEEPIESEAAPQSELDLVVNSAQKIEDSKAAIETPSVTTEVESAASEMVPSGERIDAPINGEEMDLAILGAAIHQYITRLKETKKGEQDIELQQQIQTKDELIEKLKIKCNKLLSDNNHLSEVNANLNRLVREKTEEASRVRSQHNTMIEELTKSSNSKVSLRQVARITGSLGLSEFRDSLPSNEEAR